MKKRAFSLMFAIIIAFLGIVGRVGYISFCKDFNVSSTYNSITFDVDELYPTIYDSKMNKLSNKTAGYVAVIRPNQKCMAELEKIFSKAEIKEITKELSNGYPVVRSIDKFVSCKYIKVFKTENRSGKDDEIILKDIEKKFQTPVGSIKINYNVDAKGRILDGSDGNVIYDNYDSKAGVETTIDSRVQGILDGVKNDIKNGAVVVLDAKTSNILGSISTYENENINLAFSPVSVGSVFKIVVAAAAIENNIDFEYECTGKTKVLDTEFTCQYETAHGKVDVKTALAKSCNCYFINLAQKIGKEKIYKTASELGFGDTTKLFDNWVIGNGNLPSQKTLSSLGQLSLLGFGQGELTASPLQMAGAMSAVINDGVYKSPNLILSTVDENGIKTPYNSSTSKKVFSKETARKLREYLRFVVEEGTGKNADYNKKSAGKTSTAQTGQFKDDKEILNTWFLGFYPFDNPKYIIVVTKIDGKSGSHNCCPIFRTVVEKLSNE